MKLLAKNISSTDCHIIIVDRAEMYAHNVENVIHGLRINGVVRNARTMESANEIIEKYDICMVVLFLHDNDKVELLAIRKLLADSRNMKVLIVSHTKDKVMMRQMLCIGALGFLLNDSTTEQFRQAIINVVGNERFFPYLDLDVLTDHEIEEKKSKKVHAVVPERDKKILNLIAKGEKIMEVADKLILGKSTVKARLAFYRLEYNVHKTSQAIAIMKEEGRL